MRSKEFKITKEAREWLQNNPKALKMIGQPQIGEPKFGLLGADAIGDLVERIYAMGAKKIWVCGIENIFSDYVANLAAKVELDTYTMETADVLEVELPNDVKQRKALFALHEEFFGDEYLRKEKNGGWDKGQKSILFAWN